MKQNYRLNKDKCDEDKPIIVYLCNFSNINMQLSDYDVKFLYNNLDKVKVLGLGLLPLKN